MSAMMTVTLVLLVTTATACGGAEHEGQSWASRPSPGVVKIGCTRSMAACADEAVQACPGGYEVMDRGSDDTGGVSVGTRLYGTTVVRERRRFEGYMVIRCERDDQ